MSKTILVIDDDASVLRSYGRLLARLGQKVRLVDDAEAARSDPGLLQGVDLLILDERMPGVSGLDLLATLRGRRPEGEYGPAVILVSALLSDDQRARAERLGVAEVIEKPVAADRLLASVRGALGVP